MLPHNASGLLKKSNLSGARKRSRFIIMHIFCFSLKLEMNYGDSIDICNSCLKFFEVWSWSVTNLHVVSIFKIRARNGITVWQNSWVHCDSPSSIGILLLFSSLEKKYKMNETSPYVQSQRATDKDFTAHSLAVMVVTSTIKFSGVTGQELWHCVCNIYKSFLFAVDYSQNVLLLEHHA